MRILRVISSMAPENGGPCQGIRNSIPAQKYFGIQNEVVCFDAPNAEFIARETFKIHAVGPVVGPYAFCPKLSSWLRANLQSFDVVIIHGLWLHNSYGTYRVWRQLKKMKKKVPKLYVMPHGMLDPYFQKTKSRRFKALRNWVFWKLIEKRVINGADGLFFTCEQELLLARKTFEPYKPNNEINIGYGIELPPEANEESILKFSKKCPGLLDRPYLLFLSRLHPKKGVDILIKTFIKLKNELDNIPDLVIAGPGLNSPFGKMLVEMGKNEPIHFPGMLEGSEKWGAFYGCDAFILPSHQENFGIAVVEALACGKPVLISSQVNIYREIEKGNAGLICENTEEGICSMLKYWIKETENKKKEMGRNALKVYESNFTVEKAAMRMIDCAK